eukprot:1158697-Pelagomonas_calceolata.AAC.7
MQRGTERGARRGGCAVMVVVGVVGVVDDSADVGWVGESQSRSPCCPPARGAKWAVGGVLLHGWRLVPGGGAACDAWPLGKAGPVQRVFAFKWAVQSGNQNRYCKRKTMHMHLKPNGALMLALLVLKQHVAVPQGSTRADALI